MSTNSDGTQDQKQNTDTDGTTKSWADIDVGAITGQATLTINDLDTLVLHKARQLVHEEEILKVLPGENNIAAQLKLVTEQLNLLRDLLVAAQVKQLPKSKEITFDMADIGRIADYVAYRDSKLFANETLPWYRRLPGLRFASETPPDAKVGFTRIRVYVLVGTVFVVAMGMWLAGFFRNPVPADESETPAAVVTVVDSTPTALPVPTMTPTPLPAELSAAEPLPAMGPVNAAVHATPEPDCPVVWGGTWNVRSGPGTEFPVLGMVSAGTVLCWSDVAVHEDDSTWLEWYSERIGWGWIHTDALGRAG